MKHFQLVLFTVVSLSLVNVVSARTWDQWLFKCISFLFQPLFLHCEATTDCSTQEFCSEQLCIPKTSEMFQEITPIIAQRAIYSLTFALATFYEEAVGNFTQVICDGKGYYTALKFVSPEGHRFDLYRGASPDFDILAFKGTASLDDILADLDYFLVNCPLTTKTPCGKVHQGFLTVLNQMLTAIDNALERPLLLTGHSMGGALATLASMYIVDKYGPEYLVGVYVSGSPKVGDTDFVEAFQQVVVRNVEVRRFMLIEAGMRKTEFDPITLLPGFRNYDHVVPAIPTVCKNNGTECTSRDLHKIPLYIDSHARYLQRQNVTEDRETILSMFTVETFYAPGNNTLDYEEEMIPSTFIKRGCADWF